jgi:hypothetical protein
MPEAAPSAFETALTSQRHLEQALSGAGFDVDADFPLMTADVDPLGDARIQVGPISTTTADRLCRAIGGRRILTPSPHVGG